ncbi:MAG: ribonuclease R [Lachnospiraceae bacterium]|nr:ribonuclease R [Lachnospiraceae bacterium]MBQ9123131.1 ribonuclease R [Lachnospiraceae bacterium]
MKEKELAIFLQVKKEDRDALRQILDELMEEGEIYITSKGKYLRGNPAKVGLGTAKQGTNQGDSKLTRKGLIASGVEGKGKYNRISSDSQETEIITGTFVSHPKGFGFVEIDGSEEDLFIPEEYTGGAFHKDIVEVQFLPPSAGKRREARVVKIVERGITTLVGTYQKSKNFGFVVPDNDRFADDIFVPIERSKGAVDGHKVVVELTDYGRPKTAHQKGKSPEGKVVEILGHINDPGVDIMCIVKGFDLPMEFGEKVLNQAERVSKPVSDADREGRLDLRDVVMVTIDGEDAKDLDDAVSLTVEDDKYRLGVHIADVTNYVQENSALDREALKRGTSVYLVDRVIPMLPHVLSNGICSLNQGEDRLALSCLMDFDEKGSLLNYEIAETVINVNQRMSYTSVKKILEGDAEENAKYEALVLMFKQMAQLSGILRAKRHQRGAIDFDFPESKIILDRQGHPLEIRPYDRNVATKMIEDFMLAANETIAQHFYWLELPFVYRVHEKPDPEKIQKLSAFIQNMGYFIKGGAHPKEIQKLLSQIEGTPEEALISRLALRSMKQARYTPECGGHFGLACDYYTHFTSPIRRYPDLQIHRIIKEQLRGRLSDERCSHYDGILPEVTKHASEMERRADEAERETDKLKKVEFMADHIGEVFDGVISGVTAWGIYVELPNSVEGLVHVSKIPGDYFYYREETYDMVGESTGQTYKLGQTVKVRVQDCDKAARTIDFGLVEGED